MNGLDDFYLTKTEPNKSCFLALRDIILNSYKDLSETVKYGMPCFCLGKKALCYLWIDKVTNWPYILFVDGNKLSHPALESGTRKRMKTLPINPSEDIQVDQIHQILSDAVKLISV